VTSMSSPWTAVAYTHDGTTLISGSRNGTVLLWDPSRKTTRGDRLQLHKTEITAVVTAGDRLVSADLTGRIVVWDPTLLSTDWDVWRRRLCRITGRSLTRAEWSDFVPTGAYRRTCG